MGLFEEIEQLKAGGFPEEDIRKHATEFARQKKAEADTLEAGQFPPEEVKQHKKQAAKELRDAGTPDDIVVTELGWTPEPPIAQQRPIRAKQTPLTHSTPASRYLQRGMPTNSYGPYDIPEQPIDLQPERQEGPGAGYPAYVMTPAEEAGVKKARVASLGSQRKAVGLIDAWDAGWQNSITGLTMYGQMPVVEMGPVTADFISRDGFKERAMKIAAFAGQTAGDVPFMLASMLPSAATFGLATGVATAATAGKLAQRSGADVTRTAAAIAAGAAVGLNAGSIGGVMAMTEAMRHELIQEYKLGRAKTWWDYWERKAASMVAGTKGYLTGASAEFVGAGTLALAGARALGAVGSRAGVASFAEKLAAGRAAGGATRVAEFAGKVVTMTTVGHALEGQALSLDDYITTALSLGALHGVQALGSGAMGGIKAGTSQLANKLMDWHVKYKLDPLTLDLSDPRVRDAAMSKNSGPPLLDGEPIALDENDVPAYAATAEEVKGAPVSIKRTEEKPKVELPEKPTEADIAAKRLADLNDRLGDPAIREKIVQKMPKGLNPQTVLQEFGTYSYHYLTAEMKEFFDGARDMALDSRPGEWLPDGGFQDAELPRKTTELVGLERQWVALMDEANRITAASEAQIKTLKAEEAKAEPKIEPEVTVELPPPSPNEIGFGERNVAAATEKKEGPRTPPLTMEEVIFNTVDSVFPIEQMERAVNLGDLFGTEQSPSSLSRLVAGAPEAAMRFLHDTTFSIVDQTVTGKGLKAIVKDAGILDKPLVTDPTTGRKFSGMDRLNSYLIAENTLEILGLGYKSKITRTEAQHTVNSLRAEFGDVAKEVVAYNNRLSQILVDAKVLSPADLTKMQDVRTKYVPMRRFLDPETGPETPTGKNQQVFQPIRHQKGSEKTIVNVFQTIADNTVLYHHLAARNLAGQALLKLAAVDKNTGVRVVAGSEAHVEVIPNRKMKIDIKPEELQRAMDDLTVDSQEAMALAENFDFSVWRDQRHQVKPGEIAVRDGKDTVFLKVSPLVARAFMAVDHQSLGRMVRALAVPADLLRMGATGTPEFNLNNIIKDQVSAWLFSKNGYVPGLDFVKGLKSIWSRSDLFQERRAVGGKTGTELSQSNLSFEEIAADLGERTGLFEKKWNVVKNGYTWVRGMMEMAEDATKQGEYERARGLGKSARQAALEAREVNIDKVRSGAHPAMRAYNAVTAFQNAKIQGMDKTRRWITEDAAKDPVGTAVGLWYALIMPALTSGILMLTDPKGRAANREEGDAHVRFPTTDWRPATRQEAADMPEGMSRQRGDKYEIDNGSILRLPVTEGIGPLVNGTVQRMLRAAHDEDPRAFKNFGEALLQQLNPLGVPAALMPFGEVYTGKDWHYGNDLLPAHRENVMPEAKYTTNTTELTKAIADFESTLPWAVRAVPDKLGLTSPVYMERFIKGWFGQGGVYLTQLADASLRKAGVLDNPSKPTTAWYDTLFARGYVSRYPSQHIQAVVDFEDRMKEVSTKMNTLKVKVEEAKARGRDVDMTRIEKLIGRYEGDGTLDRRSSAQGYYNALASMKKLVSAVTAEQESSPAEKRQATDILFLSMWRVAEDGNRVLDDIEKGLK